MLVALLCSLLFGPCTLPLVTLNWQEYSGHDGGWGKVDHRPFYAYIVQLWVMLFPVFDMLSVFPLVAITLGNNMMDTMPQVIKSKLLPNHLKLICRLIAAAPPIALAAALGRLDKIFTFTGLFAFFLQLIFPCWLQLVSSRLCIRRWGKGTEVTSLSWIWSHPIYQWITIVFGTGALIFAFIAFVAPNIL